MREIRNTKIIAVVMATATLKLPTRSPLPESPLTKQTQSLPETFLNTMEPITGSAKGTKNLSRIRLWMKIIIS